jgi:hypothetical protein
MLDSLGSVLTSRAAVCPTNPLLEFSAVPSCRNPKPLICVCAAVLLSRELPLTSLKLTILTLLNKSRKGGLSWSTNQAKGRRADLVVVEDVVETRHAKKLGDQFRGGLPFRNLTSITILIILHVISRPPRTLHDAAIIVLNLQSSPENISLFHHGRSTFEDTKGETVALDPAVPTTQAQTEAFLHSSIHLDQRKMADDYGSTLVQANRSADASLSIWQE